MEKYRQIKNIKTKEDGGRVWLAESVVNKRLVVIKQVQAVDREIKLLASLEHPNVIRLLDWFVEKSGRVALVVEYCELGDLREFSHKHSSSLSAHIPEITIQLLLALKYLHAMGIIHRDLKLENVFVSGWQAGILRVKVGDFGVAKQMNRFTEQTETILGTPVYFSPEQASRRPYDYAVDVWSLGCLIYKLASGGRSPFGRSDSLGQLLLEIQADEVDFDIIAQPQVRQILRMMLQKDPTKRASIDEILNHSVLQLWIADFVYKINGRNAAGEIGSGFIRSSSESNTLLLTIQQAQTTRNDPLREAHAKQCSFAQELPLNSAPELLHKIQNSVYERLAAIVTLPSKIDRILQVSSDFEALKTEIGCDNDLKRMLDCGLIADLQYLKRLQSK